MKKTFPNPKTEDAAPAKKLLMTASTFAHIMNFHLPYLADFKRLGWVVHVACGGEQREVPYADRCISVPIVKSFTSVSNLKASAMLRELMKTERYDLVITHTSLAAFFTRLAEKGLKNRPRTINVVHGYLFDDRTSRKKAAVLKTAEYLAAPQTDLVLTMNRYDKEWAEAHSVSKAVGAIPGMGVDESKLAAACKKADFGFRESDFVLVYPAEFSERKSQEMLIRAMADLPKDVKLFLPGNGALLEKCKELAAETGVSDRVVFPGYVKDAGSILSFADVAVSSSRLEGLPFNIAEAMLSSLPVIASRVKGNEDLVEDGVTGFLFEYNDAGGFADKVKLLFTDREACRRMGAAGREKAQAYTLASAEKQVMDAYLTV